MYVSWGREKERLELTQAIADVWNLCLSNPDADRLINDYETVITEKVKYEWGQTTEIEFIRDDRKIIIKNKGREKIFQYGDKK